MNRSCVVFTCRDKGKFIVKPTVDELTKVGTIRPRSPARTGECGLVYPTGAKKPAEVFDNTEVRSYSLSKSFRHV